MTTSDESNSREAQRQLFTLRFWPEDLGDEHWEWRGKVHHVSTGEVRFFREWMTLKDFVEGLLQEAICK